MLGDAEIPVAGRRPVILVPSDAVQQMNGQDTVFVRTAADHFTVRAVETGEIADGRTPILHGIREGEQVVIRGSFILKSQLLRSSLENE
jgi:cobalt-zinc-cadmium efflux system membrane fusion protein